MESLESQLEKNYQEGEEILEKIDERNKNKEIICSCCEKSYKIKNLTIIQTHWYTPPWGCTGGDYWNEGELQFICPETEIKNRLLFSSNFLERDYKNNPEEQFKRNYKKLFHKIIDSYDEHIGGWINNYYVDKNRRKFGLIEKDI